ncbi:MAG: CHRD domain-containing protein [Caulobacterales bacterium]
MLLALATQAGAATVHFKAHLTGSAEVPPVKTIATGDLTGNLDPATKLFTYKVTYNGLTGPATMAHFHGPAGSGKTAPPAMMIADPASPISSQANLTDAQVADLRKGLWYLNVHTAAHPDGEIRGQVKQDNWAQAESPTRPPPQGYMERPPMARSPGDR